MPIDDNTVLCTLKSLKRVDLMLNVFYDNFKTRIILPSDTMKSTNERENETKEDSNNYILADERKLKYMLTGLW